MIARNCQITRRAFPIFTVNLQDISRIAHDFGISSSVVAFSELQRYRYEEDDPASKEVRLIVKAELNDGGAVVIRFKNESDVTLETVNAQSRFAQLLADHGVRTPTLFTAGHAYAQWYTIGGYDVIVTVEAFVSGEVRAVTEDIAEKTGGLLARMHNIAEENAFHVPNEVLFDPLKDNDLFSFSDFQGCRALMRAVDEPLYDEIVAAHDALLQTIRVFENEPRYAVQGDVSNCNLFQTADGELGVFDFNRCGDNVLYYDAIMQAIFEARLMDYPKEIAGAQESILLAAFLRGYHRERPFTDAQKAAFPALYAMISAFWRFDILFNDDSLCCVADSGDAEAVRRKMKDISARIRFRPEMPL